MQKTFTYKKYSNDVLKKFADTIMTYGLGNTYEQLDESESLKNLDELGGSKNQEDKISENLTALSGQFPTVVKPGFEEQHTALEVVPGEILKMNYWGGGSMITEWYYKINNDNLESISVIPKNKSFYTALNRNINNKKIEFYNNVLNANTWTLFSNQFLVFLYFF